MQEQHTTRNTTRGSSVSLCLAEEVQANNKDTEEHGVTACHDTSRVVTPSALHRTDVVDGIARISEIRPVVLWRAQMRGRYIVMSTCSISNPNAGHRLEVTVVGKAARLSRSVEMRRSRRH